MASLYHKVKLYLEDNSKTVSEFNEKNILLQDEGDGVAYIHTWNVSGLEQPTEEQLNSYSAQADIAEANVDVVYTRIKEYGSTAEQLEYIVENGVDAFITKQNQIKTENPKS